MADPTPKDVTLNTLHEDLTGGFADLKGEVRGGFADLKVGIADVKVTLVAGFRNMPTREDSQGMIRLLRERIRILKRRPRQIRALDARIREQSLVLQEILRALSEEIQRLRRRGDGEPIA